MMLEVMSVAGEGKSKATDVVAVAQSGCFVTVAVGAAGADGTVLTVRLNGAETQPVPFFTVTL